VSDSGKFEKLLDQLRSGRGLEEIVGELPRGNERELLRRCAVARSFDRTVFDEILCKVPSLLEVDAQSFVRVTTSSAIEPISSPAPVYRLRPDERSRYLATWQDSERAGLRELQSKLLEHAENFGDHDSVLYLQARLEPGQSAALFKQAFTEAERRADLTACDRVINLFDLESKPADLDQAIKVARARLGARALWSEPFYRTGSFLERRSLTNLLERLLDSPEADSWALLLHAAGGLGKTMFLQWAIARWCVPRGVPCALINFDYSDPAVIAAEPWVFALEIARQWNKQIPGGPLGSVIDRLERWDSSSSENSLAHLVAALDLPGKVQALIVLDTLEEVLIPRRHLLDRILGHLQGLRGQGARGERIRVILSGRYNLAQRLTPAELALTAPQPIVREILRFHRGESRDYLTRLRKHPEDDRVDAVVERCFDPDERSPGCTPLKLWLLSEVIKSEPHLTAQDIREIPQEKLDVEYLIQRVINRIGATDLGPDGQPLPQYRQLRWVLRYGVIPRRLTLDFLLAQRIRELLDNEIVGKTSRDKTNLGLTPKQAELKPWSRTPEIPPGIQELWEMLKTYAGESSWVRFAPAEPNLPEALVFTPDVVNPMRALLLEQEGDIFRDLHTGAMKHFKGEATRLPIGSLERLHAWREVTYHDFQRRGEAAGPDWIARITTDEFRDRPGWRKVLAEEVTGLGYLTGDESPSPLPRKDGTRMIAPSTMARAFFERVRASAELARSDPARAAEHWRASAVATGLLDNVSRRTGASPEGVGAETVEFFGALVQAHSPDGPRSNAVETLSRLSLSTDRDLAFQALTQLGLLLSAGTDEKGIEVLSRWLDQSSGRAQPAAIVDMRLELAHLQVYFDVPEAATASCETAFEEIDRLDEDEGPRLTRADLVWRESLLRAGRPAAVFASYSTRDRILEENRPAGWSAAIWGYRAEASLFLLDPIAALNYHRAARDERKKAVVPDEAGSHSVPMPGPDTRAQRGRIANVLMNFQRGVRELNEAADEWTQFTGPAASNWAHDVLAERIALHLDQFQDLNGAQSLLSNVPAGLPAPGSEPDLRLALLRAQWHDRRGRSDEARSIVDALLANLDSDAPPRFHVRTALAGLTLRAGPVHESYALRVLDALNRIDSPTARAALLGPLARCPGPLELSRPLANRLIELVAEPAHLQLTPRERAVFLLRRVELLRVIGQPNEALESLAIARDLLLGSQNPFAKRTSTTFPLLELLRAEDRLGPPEIPCFRAAEWLPFFAKEFEADLYRLLVAAAWVDQSERALRTADRNRLEEAILEADRRLQRSELPGAAILNARLFRVRSAFSARREMADDAQRFAAQARVVEERLGLPEVAQSSSVTQAGPKEIGLKLGLQINFEVDQPAVSNVDLEHVAAGSVSVKSPPVAPPTLCPIHPFLAFVATHDPDQGLSLRSAGTEGPSMRSDVVSKRADVWQKLPSSDQPAPLELVTALEQDWDRFAKELGGFTSPSDWIRLLEFSGWWESFDLRLESSDPTSAPLPWELATFVGIEPFRADQSKPRCIYRSAGGADGVTLSWLRSALRQLIDPGLAVYGADETRLRQALVVFQEREGLKATGQADAETRWLIDRRLQSLRNHPPRAILLIANIPRGHDRSLNLDLVRLTYRELGFELITVEAAEAILSASRKVLEGKVLCLVHVIARLVTAPSQGVYFDLGGDNGSESHSSGGWALTTKLFDEFLRSLPEGDVRPWIVLDPPRPSSRVEAVRQLFLRNAFAAELFRLGNSPTVLAAGLDAPANARDRALTVASAVAVGRTPGDLARSFQGSFDKHSSDPSSLYEILCSAATALFARDPDARAPGSGRSETVPSPERSVRVTRTLYALLVGINDYPPPLSRLAGCLNDVEAFANFLRSQVDRSLGVYLQLLILGDDQATRQAVIESFRSHLARAQRGDVALFYFSGRGSQAPAPQEFWHVEPDRLNETLVCYDSRSPGGWDLADKELDKLIEQVAAGGAHTVVILDCCHSGSGTRGISVRSDGRRAPLDNRTRPASSCLVWQDDKDGASGAPGPAEVAASWTVGRHMLLAACRENEEAGEYVSDDGPRGAFSYFLLVSLETRPGQQTYRDLMSRTSALVRSVVPYQTPQLEATHSEDLDLVFLDGALRPVERWYRVSFDSSEREWRVEAGALQGLPTPTAAEPLELTLFSFDASEETMRDRTRARGKARVTRIGSIWSPIELLAMDAPGPTETLKAVVSRLPLAQVLVRMEGEETGVNMTRRALAGAGPNGEPSLYCREARDNEAAEFRLLAREAQFTIAGPANDLPLVGALDGFTEANARKLIERIEHIARWTTLARLSNPTSSIGADDIALAILIDSKAVAGVEVRIAYSRGAQGEWVPPQVQISLTNKSSRTLYCALLDLTQSYGIFADMTTGGYQRASSVTTGGCIRIGPGQMVHANGGEPISVSIPDEIAREGVVEYNEILKLVVSTAEFDARVVAQPDIDQESPASRSTQGEASGLNSLMERIQTRGLESGESRTLADWTATSLIFTTVRPLPDREIPSSGASVELASGVVLSSHPLLRAKARLSTEPLALRELGDVNFPRLLLDDPTVCVPFIVAGPKIAHPGLSVIELLDVENADGIRAEFPLRLTASVRLTPGEQMLPVAFDGEFFVSLGHALATEDNRTEIVIERLPIPNPSARFDRNLARPIRVFLEKVVCAPATAELGRAGLAAVEVDSSADRETAIYVTDHARIRTLVAQAPKILLLVHGLVGDTREQHRGLRQVTLADGKSLDSNVDLVLTFDYDAHKARIEDAGLQLKDQLERAGLKPGHGKQLTILAQTTGGLVARWFIERDGGDQVATRLVMCGTPNVGVSWPSLRDWSSAVLALGLNQFTSMVWPASVLRGLVRVTQSADASIEQFRCGSSVLQSLNDGEGPAIPYLVIAGTSSLVPHALSPESIGQSPFDRLLSRVVDSADSRAELARLFGAQENDLAVAEAIGRDLGGSASTRASSDPSGKLAIKTAACDHFTYFQSREVLEFIREVL